MVSFLNLFFLLTHSESSLKQIYAVLIILLLLFVVLVDSNGCFKYTSCNLINFCWIL